MPRTKEALTPDGETGEDYKLRGEWVWIKVRAPRGSKWPKDANKTLLVKIKKTDEGVIVDLFNDKDLRETGGMANPLSTLSAMYQE